MKTSEAINEISAALALAQGAMKAPTKDKTAKIPGKEGKTGFEYKYADLANVIETAKGELAKNGLAIVQTMSTEENRFGLFTRLVHKSGQWFESMTPLPTGVTPQQLGSALTYYRRYAMTGIIGVAADDDDDGMAAQDMRSRSAPSTRQMPARSNAQPPVRQSAKTEGFKIPERPGDLLLAPGKSAKTVKDLSFDEATKAIMDLKKGNPNTVLKGYDAIVERACRAFFSAPEEHEPPPPPSTGPQPTDDIPF